MSSKKKAVVQYLSETFIENYFKDILSFANNNIQKTLQNGMNAKSAGKIEE